MKSFDNFDEFLKKIFIDGDFIPDVVVGLTFNKLMYYNITSNKLEYFKRSSNVSLDKILGHCCGYNSDKENSSLAINYINGHLFVESKDIKQYVIYE